MLDEHHVFSLCAFATMRCWLASSMMSSMLLDGGHGIFLLRFEFEFGYPGFAIADLTLLQFWSWLLALVSRFLEGKTGWAIYSFYLMC